MTSIFSELGNPLTNPHLRIPKEVTKRFIKLYLDWGDKKSLDKKSSYGVFLSWYYAYLTSGNSPQVAQNKALTAVQSRMKNRW